jgi:chloramphenicol-sensitive protein RarD
MVANASPSRSSGFALAIGAYLIWGLLPAYMLLVQSVPPLEFLSWRVLFTLPICLVMIAVSGRRLALLDAVQSPRLLAALLLTATLIGSNWLVFVLAVTSGHVYAASLGYYMNPLVNILIGTIFLHERLSPRLWIAVALAGTGVAILFAGALDSLWITLILAVSFSIYGLVRKLAPVDAVSGLTIESALLSVPSLIYVGYLAGSPDGMVFGQDLQLSATVAFAGILTAAPLTMFTLAAQRMEYSSIAFTQFVSPTLIFIQGLLLFEEPMRPAQAASFLLIWIAVAVFCWDILSRKKTRAKA